MNKTTPKRIGALILAIVMCLSLFPTAAFAVDDKPAPESQEVNEAAGQAEEKKPEPAPQPEPEPAPQPEPEPAPQPEPEPAPRW